MHRSGHGPINICIGLRYYVEMTVTKSLIDTKRVVVAVAGIWALLVGGILAGIASIFDVDGLELVLVGVLGGFGAAASVFVFMPKIRADEKTNHSVGK